MHCSRTSSGSPERPALLRCFRQGHGRPIRPDPVIGWRALHGPRRYPAAAVPGRWSDDPSAGGDTAAERLELGLSHIRRRAVSAASAPLEPLPSGCSCVPLGPGPNRSRIRLSSVPLRWSHACLLQLNPTVTVAKPDMITVSGRSVPAFAKHIRRLRPPRRQVNTEFSAGILFAPARGPFRNAPSGRSMTWTESAALPKLQQRPIDLQPPISFPT